jgi:hypothetical protein
MGIQQVVDVACTVEHHVIRGIYASVSMSYRTGEGRVAGVPKVLGGRGSLPSTSGSCRWLK